MPRIRDDDMLKALKAEADFYLMTAFLKKITLNVPSYLFRTWQPPADTMSDLNGTALQNVNVFQSEELVTVIETPQLKFRCPRGITVHTGPSNCGRKCRNKGTGVWEQLNKKYLIIKKYG